jgi:hypothetical protein
MSAMPVTTATGQPIRRAHCEYCGGKGDSSKAEYVQAKHGTYYRIPASHVSCKTSVLSLSLSLSLDKPRGKRTKKQSKGVTHATNR